MNNDLNTVLWELFEILVNFFQAFIMIHFVNSYLGKRKTKKYFISETSVITIILGISISVMNHFFVFEHLFLFVYVVILTIYVVTSLKGTVLQKIFAIIFPTTLVAILSVFISNIMAFMLDTNLVTILSLNNLDRFITIIVVQLTVFYCIIFSLKLFENDKNKKLDLTIIEWCSISIILILSLSMAILLNFISLNDVPYEVRIYSLMLLLCLILINIVVSYIIKVLGNKNIIMLRNQALDLEKEYVKFYVETADEKYEFIKKQRHDFIDNYTTILTLIKNNNIEDAEKYIESNLELVLKNDIFVNTNNNVVNAVINHKLSKATSYGIDVTCLSISNFDSIEDVDLSKLISNMLENSITACKNINSNKQIILKIFEYDCSYVFSVKNTIETSVLNVNPNLTTTKSNEKEHGYGLKIIKDIADKYDGFCDFFEENNYFNCDVTLYKNK